MADYGGPGAAAGDVTYTLDIPDNAGLALFNTADAADFSLENRLDAAGSAAETNGLYREGAGSTALVTTPGAEHSFHRSACSFVNGVGCSTPGLPQDTGDAAARPPCSGQPTGQCNLLNLADGHRASSTAPH